MYELQTWAELLHSAMNNTEIKGFASIYIHAVCVWSMAKGRKPLENKNIEWHLILWQYWVVQPSLYSGVMTILSCPT